MILKKHYLFLVLVCFAVFGCRSRDIRTYQKKASQKPGLNESVPSNRKWADLKQPERMNFNPGDEYFWVLETSKGIIRIKLWPEKAPIHVTSVIYLTNIEFYKGMEFYRIIPGFLTQSGCPIGDGSGEVGYTVEFEQTADMDHDRPYLVGTVNRDEHSDSSQFYITFGKANQLDGLHTIFGEVIESQEVVDAIETLGSRKGRPKAKVIIVSASIDTRIDTNPSGDGQLVIEDLTASHNKRDAVIVEWTICPSATEYRVIRCKKGTSYKYASEWQSSTSYEDKNAVMGSVYEYWVQARNGVRIGDLNGPVAGYRREAKPKGKLRIPYEIY